MEDIFWTAFTDADELGEETIKTVLQLAFLRWRNSVHELTDLIMVINHKCWDHHEKGNEALSKLYGDLYYEYYEKAINHLEERGREEDLSYFIRTLD